VSAPQVLQADAPGTFEYVPPGHGTQYVSPGDVMTEYLPASQLEHADAWTFEYVPDPQLTQVVGPVAPVTGEYFPAGQLAQNDSPWVDSPWVDSPWVDSPWVVVVEYFAWAVPNFPAPQLTQTVGPVAPVTFENFPVGQSVQNVCPYGDTTEYFPAPQVKHADATAFENVPAPQSTQAAGPVAPVTFENLPAGQKLQYVGPVFVMTEYLPATQSTQPTATVPTEAVPTAVSPDTYSRYFPAVQ